MLAASLPDGSDTDSLFCFLLLLYRPPHPIPFRSQVYPGYNSAAELTWTAQREARTAAVAAQRSGAAGRSVLEGSETGELVSRIGDLAHSGHGGTSPVRAGRYGRSGGVFNLFHTATNNATVGGRSVFSVDRQRSFAFNNSECGRRRVDAYQHRKGSSSSESPFLFASSLVQVSRGSTSFNGHDRARARPAASKGLGRAAHAHAQPGPPHMRDHESDQIGFHGQRLPYDVYVYMYM